MITRDFVSRTTSHLTRPRTPFPVSPPEARNERGRFVTFTTLLFFAVALGFGLPFVLQSLFGGLDEATAGTGAGTAHIVIGGFPLVIVVSPFVAALSGALAGLHLDESPSTAGITGGTGAFVGFAVLTVVLFGMGFLGGAETNPVSDIFASDPVYPVTMGVGVAVTGFGAAYATNRFVR